MAKRLFLNEDPRWLPFCEAYAGSLERFAIEVQGVQPTPQQLELYRSTSPSRSRTTVASGHGCFAAGTMVMLAGGEALPVEQVQPEMCLEGPDGLSRRVECLIRGREAMHRIQYAGGGWHDVNASHLLCLVRDGEYRTQTVRGWLAEPDRLTWCAYRLVGGEFETVEIVGSVDLGVGDYYGFELDGPDGRFLGADGVVLHNTGKTTSIANVVLWHLLCYPQSITLLTANDMDQLKATLWKEIGIAIERIRRGRHGWIAEHVEVLANATMRIIGFEDTWFVESKTANEKTANKMAGRHGEWLLIIGDEASTLPDTVLSTLRGALTEQHNRMLLTSQPTRNAGFFWRTHHELAKDNGGEWNNLTFSSLESPLVSDDALKELWDAYDDDERRVRLMGLFPQDSSKHMMSLKVAMRMYGRSRIIKDNEPYGWVVLSDVASGEGLRDKSAVLAARVIGYGDRGLDARRVEIVEIPLMTNTIRSNRIYGPIMEVGEQLDGVTYGVDSGGLGVNVCQDLEDAGKVVHRINWGNPCFQNKNKDRYLNLRAQAMHQAARAAKEGRLVVLTNEHKNTMLAQASRIPKTFSDKGRIRVPPKHSPEWEGMASPDLWDAVCFAFLENLTYVAAQDKSGSVMTLGDRAEEAVESLFAGL